HFPATRASAKRILKLGEDRWRIHQVGAPGIDGITKIAGPRSMRERFALVALHPVDPDERMEQRRAEAVLAGVEKVGFDRIVIVHPNNDPGSEGIVRCW